MTPFEEYVQRHNLDINPSDYGFETVDYNEPPEPSCVRVTRSEVSVESLWSFFVCHHNLDDWTRREFFRNGIDSINREQRIVFAAYPYLASIWESWRISTPDFFRPD